MTIADKLEAARKAALASGGVKSTDSAAAAVSGFKTGMTNSIASPPRTPSKTSALRPEDMLPKKTKASQILFWSPKANFNTVFAAVGKDTKRINFVNQHFITEDPELIAYLRENATHFGIKEVTSAVVPTDQGEAVRLSNTRPAYPIPQTAGMTAAELRAAADALDEKAKTDNELRYAADLEIVKQQAKETAAQLEKEAQAAKIVADRDAQAAEDSMLVKEQKAHERALAERSVDAKAAASRIASASVASSVSVDSASDRIATSKAAEEKRTADLTVAEKVERERLARLSATKTS